MKNIYYLLIGLLLTAAAHAQSGAALDFDGADDRISFMTAPAISGSFTVEAWVKPSEATKTMHIISTRTNGDFSFDIQILNGNTIHGDIGNGTQWLTTTANASFAYSINTWLHIAYVVTPTGYRIYANGNLVGSGTYSGTPMFIGGSRQMQLGAYSAENTYFKGQMDEVRIWNRALTQCEIQNNRTTELSVQQAGLAAYYKFNEGDAFGSNNGTVFNPSSAVTNLPDSATGNYAGTLINFGLTNAISNWIAPGAVTTGSTSPAFSLLSVTSPQVFCDSAAVSNLTATGTAIKWYNVQTGGSALASGTALSTGTYYVTQTTTGGCESDRVAVSITVTAPPTAAAQFFCNSATVASLTATGTAIKWYTALTGGNPMASGTPLYTATFYASQTVGSCESSRTAVSVTLAPKPTASPHNLCHNETVADLVATGTAIKWYAAFTGGSPLASSTPLVTGFYYASQTVDGCESNRTTVSVTVTTAPAASAQSFCNSGRVLDLTPSGMDIKWYTVPTGGSAMGNVTALATGTYYVCREFNGCETSRTAVSVTVTTAPTASSQSFCNSATVADLAATGTAIKWYNVQTGGSALATSTALSTGTYYASQTVGSCESNRTAVSVTVTTAPAAASQAFCNSGTVADLVATGTAIKWYTAQTGGSALATNTALSTGTYYASQTVGGCESNRTAVSVTVTTTPAAASQAFCNSGTVANLVATGIAIKWYTALTGGSALATNTALSTGTYYASQTVGSCESNRTAVSVTVTTAPAALPQSFCNNETVANLIATGIAIKWYTALTGGSALATSTTLSTGTYYASQTVGGCESNRTAVSVTVTTAPAALSQSFCNSGTVASLVATGTAVKWYTALTGGSALATNTALSTGTYYVSQTFNGCESTRTAVSVTVNISPAPTAESPQSSISGTIASLTATGTALQWYLAPTGGSALPLTTALTPGTYYVSQTINGCESGRTAVATDFSGAALDFDGIDDYIEFEEMPITINNSFTVEVWVKPGDATKAMHIISTREGGEASFDIQLRDGNKIHGDIGDGSSWLSIDADATYNYTVDTWLHVAYVVTPEGYTIYVNGDPLGSGTFYGLPLFLDGAHNLRLGAHGGENTQFKGQMDEVRIWDRALMACEIEGNRNTEIPENQDGLVFYYKFNQGLASGTNASETSLSDPAWIEYSGNLTNFGLNGTSSNWVRPGAIAAGVTNPYLTFPAAPAATAQSFCASAYPTVSNLVASGTSLKWYDTPTGGDVLDGTSVLTTGTYFVSTTNGCESERTEVTITLTSPSAPMGKSPQVCAGNAATVADLVATGTNIKWYSEATGGTLLPTSTVLTNGMVYYATQTVNGCESTERFAVTVQKISESSQGACNGALASLVMTPSTGAFAVWYDTPLGGTPLNLAATLASDTYYVEQKEVESLATVASFGFSQPQAVATDSFGNIYFIDPSVPWADNIKKMDSSGNNVHNWGYGLSSPKALAIDSSDNVYITTQNDRIFKFNSNGTHVQSFYGGFDHPGGIAVDAAGNIYIADTYNGAVKKIDASGNNLQVLKDELDTPTGIAVDASGNVYVANIGYDAVMKMNNSGGDVQMLGSGFNNLRSVAVDAQGNIYVAEDSLRMMSPFGNDLIPAIPGFFAGIAIHPSGDIILGDPGNYDVKKIIFKVSNRVGVPVTSFNTPAPSAPSPQTFTDSTVANLTASGTNLKWYTTAVDTTALAGTASLATGTYYVSQTLAGCESARTAVQVVTGAAALHFDGVDDYVFLPQENFNVNGSFTVEAWVKPEDVTSTMHIFSTREGNDLAFDIQITGGNTIHGDIGDGSNWLTTAADANYIYTTNTWFHIAYVVVPGGYTIYVNGNEVGSGTFSGTALLLDDNRFLSLGRHDGDATFFKGDMDEVRIWSRALTKCEIQNNLATELSEGQTGLEVYYKFNHGIARGNNTGLDTVTDSSGNNRDPNLNFFELSGNTSNWVAPGGVTTGSSSLPVTVPAAPTADAQTICSATVASLVAAGTAIRWYADAAGGNALDGSAVVVSGTYYATQTVNGCESNRIPVSLQIANTIWDGASWSNGEPDSDMSATISGTYNSTGDLNACTLTVTNNAQVIVNSGDDFKINGKVTVDVGASLTFESDANLLQTLDVANFGTIKSKRNAAMVRQDYVYWSSPVTGQNLSVFSPLTLTNRFYTLDETANAFVGIDPLSHDFTPAKGFMIRAPNTFLNPPALPQSFIGIFTGVPNNGTITMPITANSYGYNLIGNPYPSSLDAQLFLAQNPGTLYFWTHRSQGAASGANYCTFNNTGGTAAISGGNPPNGTITSGQGFMLLANANGTATFTNSMRTGNNTGTFYRMANEKHRIWLNLDGLTSGLNQILVGYIDGATNGVDIGMDGEQIEGGSSISSIINDSNYIIQGRALPFDDTDVVPLNFNAQTAGTYTISLDHVDGLFSGDQDIFLKDNLLGIAHSIKQSAYTFVSAEGSFANRFEITYQNSPLGTEAPLLDSNQITMYKERGIIRINSGLITMSNVKVFDMRGRLVYEKDDINANETSLEDLKAEQEVLLVQITSDKGLIVVRKAVH